MDGVQKLCVGGVDVDDSFISSLFKLFAAALVLVGAAQDGYYFALGGKGNGPEIFAPLFFMVPAILDGAVSARLCS